MTEFRPGSFQILPMIIKNLLIINVLVYLASISIGSTSFNFENIFALHTWQSPLFMPWQFVTHMFMHGSWGHLFFNMFALWMFGSVLENMWGPKRFLTFYIICGLGAALAHMIALHFEMNALLNDYMAMKTNFSFDKFSGFYNEHNIKLLSPKSIDLVSGFQENARDQDYMQAALQLSNDYVNARLNQPTVGASGAVYGCLAAFGYLYPNERIYIYFLFPIKAKWFVLIYTAFSLFAAIENSAGDNVAHLAHLGGAIVGFALVFFWNKTNRRTFY